MTQKQAIEKAVFSGRKLTGLKAVEMFGTLNLHKRLSEIEQKYGVRLTRKEKKFKTRFGTPGQYMEYQLDRTKYARQIESWKSKN